MTIPSVSWNENSPAGKDSITLGDNRIREMKTQIREVIDIDHKFESSGQDADNGKHNQVSLLEAADIGTGAEGKPVLGAQTIDGKAELVFTTEADIDIQMTKGNYPYYSAPENVAGMAGLLNFSYPIGIVITLGVSTNPATLLGIGTWTQIKGRVIVGIDDSGTFDTLNATMGAETVTLTAAQSGLPAHSHLMDYTANLDGGSNGGQIREGNTQATTFSTRNSVSANASEAHTNIQPTIVKYVWERTA